MSKQCVSYQDFSVSENLKTNYYWEKGGIAPGIFNLGTR